MHLRDRLALYLRLFARRGDVHIARCDWGVPARAPALPPGDIADLLGGSTVSFAWTFRPGEPTEGDGGRLCLAADHELDWQSSGVRWLDGVASSLVIDDVVAEGQGLLVVAQGDTLAGARLAFHDSNEERTFLFDSLASYLTLGARRAFAWYWQNDGCAEWQGLLERLHGRSLDAGASEAELARGLCAQGASEDEARALIGWLGADARLLVPSTGAGFVP